MLLRFPIAPCKMLPTTRLMTTTTDTATILTLFCQGSTNQNSHFIKANELIWTLLSPLRPLTMVIFPLLTHLLWAQEIPGIDNKPALFSYLSFQYQSVFLGFLASKSIVQFSWPFQTTRKTERRPPRKLKLIIAKCLILSQANRLCLGHRCSVIYIFE